MKLAMISYFAKLIRYVWYRHGNALSVAIMHWLSFLSKPIWTKDVYHLFFFCSINTFLFSVSRRRHREC